VLLAVAGLAVVLFPLAAQWFSALAQTRTISGYTERIAAAPAQDVLRALERAHVYNRQLRPGSLFDPYTKELPIGLERSPGYKQYLDILDVDGDGMMGYISIPAIDSYLPVYHGTSDETLQRGVGHLYGTALPVGGKGTHSVLTTHAGLVNAKLFTDLNKLKLSDTFSITVYGRRISYRVDQIKVVLPQDSDYIQPVAGRDYVTLITCTPPGINSHRLLVRGERIANADAGAAGQPLALRSIGPGFPWWALIALLGTLAVLLGTRRVAVPMPRRGNTAGTGAVTVTNAAQEATA
jgi:sortase A